MKRLLFLLFLHTAFLVASSENPIVGMWKLYLPDTAQPTYINFLENRHFEYYEEGKNILNESAVYAVQKLRDTLHIQGHFNIGPFDYVVDITGWVKETVFTAHNVSIKGFLLDRYYDQLLLNKEYSMNAKIQGIK